MTKIPPQYARDAQALMVLFRTWVDKESQTRAVDLRWYDWGGLAIGAALTGEALDYLCDSDDARAMCEWADEQLDHRPTLIQAMVAIETLGLKTPGEGKRLPPEMLARVVQLSYGAVFSGGPSPPSPTTRAKRRERSN